ncbi:hypothetical protein DEU56DRAFT_761149 [Suillus clintonianus]|uniref:uncharacterized protein n=1 Tax=Suillus clintonianus TaxID=1904413 RepID=UPI001B85BDD5|nr:uncharacterized protein DEU56DRAFT_761149 [Suillus clintonianus]KAG2118603.1 hypothetical protein DEU56DRAFT_761149 [Suillus clintonianus]
MSHGRTFESIVKTITLIQGSYSITPSIASMPGNINASSTSRSDIMFSLEPLTWRCCGILVTLADVLQPVLAKEIAATLQTPRKAQRPQGKVYRRTKGRLQTRGIGGNVELGDEEVDLDAQREALESFRITQGRESESDDQRESSADPRGDASGVIGLLDESFADAASESTMEGASYMSRVKAEAAKERSREESPSGSRPSEMQLPKEGEGEEEKRQTTHNHNKSLKKCPNVRVQARTNVQHRRTKLGQSVHTDGVEIDIGDVVWGTGEVLAGYLWGGFTKATFAGCFDDNENVGSDNAMRGWRKVQRGWDARVGIAAPNVQEWVGMGRAYGGAETLQACRVDLA